MSTTTRIPDYSQEHETEICNSLGFMQRMVYKLIGVRPSLYIDSLGQQDYQKYMVKKFPTKHVDPTFKRCLPKKLLSQIRNPD